MATSAMGRNPAVWWPSRAPIVSLHPQNSAASCGTPNLGELTGIWPRGRASRATAPIGFLLHASLPCGGRTTAGLSISPNSNLQSFSWRCADVSNYDDSSLRRLADEAGKLNPLSGAFLCSTSSTLPSVVVKSLSRQRTPSYERKYAFCHSSAPQTATFDAVPEPPIHSRRAPCYGDNREISVLFACTPNSCPTCCYSNVFCCRTPLADRRLSVFSLLPGSNRQNHLQLEMCECGSPLGGGSYRASSP